MLELHQDESCPGCARVRARLGELKLDFIARQGPLTSTGCGVVPVLVDPEKGMVVTETDDILAYLTETYGV